MAETAIDYPRNVTFDDVWVALMEDRERLKEFERQSRENAAVAEKEAERRTRENERRFKETDRFLKRLGRQMGDLHNTFGEISEHLVAPGIAKRFNELGFHFDSISPGGRRILDEQGKIKTEIDLLLENGEYIIAIEVKSKPKEKDIEHHIQRLEILREYREKHQEKPKKILGAIAGAVYGTAEKKAAIEAGLYVLEQSGDTMKMDLPGDFVPREW